MATFSRSSGADRIKLTATVRDRYRPAASKRRTPGPSGHLLVLLMLLLPCAVQAVDWPQEIVHEDATIVIYQPQPERLEDNILSGRAAMSIETKGGDPIFGALWFDAKLSTDQDAGTALIRDLTVRDVRWPESNDAAQQRFTAAVEAAVPASGFSISLERLSSSLEAADMERKSLENLKSDPPVIEFREELSVLLLYDGKPRYKLIEGSDYERVLNAPMAVVRRKNSKSHWLLSGKFYYEASSAMGPWRPTGDLPADLKRMVAEVEVDDSGPDSPPAIVAADEPTELVVTQGKPDWQSLPGGALLFVQNTETPWLRLLETGNMYLLLAGRWYRSKAQQGPWTFVPADELPQAFADIPPESTIGGIRTSVAGTDEANDAVLDAQIPQTAAIKRSEAKLTVEYDGKPKFEKIPGTEVAQAVNTGAQVLRVDGRFYAVDQGVWFTSGSATGPWVVADEIPEQEIQKIPPSSPAYNTTHVHIYESTPQVVYTGYTPGYLWSFPYYGVPVYGTGWRYPPYYGSWYYPRPPTWGFNVGYNPWSGWNFGMSWSNGFFSFGVSWGGGWGGAPYRPWGCCNGWYGGGYRRGPTIINTGDINIGNSVSVGNRTNIGNRIDRSNNISLDNSRTNLYNRPANRQRNADPSTALANLREARPAANRANDVFVDRNGNVAKRVDDGWQTRNDGKWTPDTLTSENIDSARSTVQDRTTQAQRDQARSAVQSGTTQAQRDQARTAAQSRTSQAQRDQARSAAQQRNIDRSSLNRDYAARQRGASRQAARPSRMGSGGARRRR